MAARVGSEAAPYRERTAASYEEEIAVLKKTVQKLADYKMAATLCSVFGSWLWVLTNNNHHDSWAVGIMLGGLTYIAWPTRRK